MNEQVQRSQAIESLIATLQQLPKESTVKVFRQGRHTLKIKIRQEYDRGAIGCGEKLKAARLAEGMERSTLAKLTDYSYQSILYFERGERTIPSDLIPLLAKILNVPIEDLTRDQ